MNQQDIAVELQHRAEARAYAHCGELARDCSDLGASHLVLSWIDGLCLSRGLYENDDLMEVQNDQERH